ncbi:hypothetical protein CI102_14125 [Trichoderma harzianum]|uniref:Secreted protein n=1 Tax=Trichoderma harzianum CBS 226.95 TaxID=983964 RepID=A0A2T4AL49_TRIHA|nr:hypothetical protein M431DRAFT_505375 [Trichoderma harzianum CBS 226.95]PKK41864.1 hypothetical protein CI102_14125 [Trichoderma harzianum]PTB57811.1 hypothetical protein M431DRAFT_505375 [Trichoderma harzianum CBS 226.95]
MLSFVLAFLFCFMLCLHMLCTFFITSNSSEQTQCTVDPLHIKISKSKNRNSQTFPRSHSGVG